MAKITICDCCKTVIDETILQVSYSGRQLVLKADIYDPSERDWRKADLCAGCLMEAAKKRACPLLEPG